MRCSLIGHAHQHQVTSLHRDSKIVRNARSGRQREFRADNAGASLAGRDSMIAALRRLAANQERIDTSKPALAAFKISDKKSWLAAFSTHPPLEVRIAALESGR